MNLPEPSPEIAQIMTDYNNDPRYMATAIRALREERESAENAAWLLRRQCEIWKENYSAITEANVTLQARLDGAISEIDKFELMVDMLKREAQK